MESSKQRVDLGTFRRILNGRKHKSSEIKELFERLDDKGWKQLEDDFKDTRKEIVRMFCEVLGEDHGK